MHVFPPDAALPSHTQETLLGKDANVSFTARERRACIGPATDRLDLCDQQEWMENKDI